MEQIPDFDKTLQAKILNLASILYARGVCHIFRQPVEILYPALYQDYKTKIKQPFDFGTLLLNCYKGKMTVGAVRDSIRLIASNAITYNKDSYDVIGLATHIEYFGAMMFEELLQIPFRPNYANQMEFSIARSANRLPRYQLIKDCHLLDSELKEIVDILQRWPQTRAPRELSIAVSISLNITNAALATRRTRKGNPAVCCEFVSLAKILDPILKVSQGAAIPQSILKELIMTMKIPSLCYLFVDLPCTTSDKYVPEYASQGPLVSGPKPEWVPWLRAIDEALGRLIVLIVERNLRGCHRSSLWARPAACVWIQSSKFAQKIPAMILAGSLHSSVPPLLTETNITRIPTSVARQLMSTLPKRPNESSGASSNVNMVPRDGTSSSSAGGESSPSPEATTSTATEGQETVAPVGKLSRMIPSGVVLVEIFGSHDLYWVKTDAITSFDENYMTIGQSPRKSELSVQEAVEVVQWMSDEKYEIPVSTDVASAGDVIVPTKEVLEKWLRIRVADNSTNAGNPVSVASPIHGLISGSLSKKSSRASPAGNAGNSATFVFNPELLSDLATNSKRNRAIVKTKAMLSWVDNFKSLIGKAEGSPMMEASSTMPLPTAKPPKGTKRKTGTGSEAAETESGIGWKSTAIAEAIPLPGAEKKAGSIKFTKVAPKKPQLSGSIEVDDAYDNNANGIDAGVSNESAARNNHSNSSNNNKRNKVSTSNRFRDAFLEEEFDKIDHIEEEAYQQHLQVLSTRRQMSVEPNPFGVLPGGCTEYIFGTGLITGRTIDVDAALFFQESRNPQIRKFILLTEMNSLQKAIDKLQEVRKLREDNGAGKMEISTDTSIDCDKIELLFVPASSS